MKRLLIAGLLGVAPLAAFADTDYRDLMLRAMNAKDGAVSVELTGRVAEMIRAQINRPNAKVIADVTTVAELKQEGCKRFQFRFTTPGTLLPMTDGQNRMLDMNFKLNMCRKGSPNPVCITPLLEPGEPDRGRRYGRRGGARATLGG